MGGDGCVGPCHHNHQHTVEAAHHHEEEGHEAHEAHEHHEAHEGHEAHAAVVSRFTTSSPASSETSGEVRGSRFERPEASPSTLKQALFSAPSDGARPAFSLPFSLFGGPQALRFAAAQLGAEGGRSPVPENAARGSEGAKSGATSEKSWANPAREGSGREASHVGEETPRGPLQAASVPAQKGGEAVRSETGSQALQSTQATSNTSQAAGQPSQTASASNAFAPTAPFIPAQASIPSTAGSSPFGTSVPAQTANGFKDVPPPPRPSGSPLAAGETAFPRVAPGTGAVTNVLNVIAQTLQAPPPVAAVPPAAPFSPAAPLPQAVPARPLPPSAQPAPPPSFLMTIPMRSAAEERLATMWGVADKKEKDEIQETEEADTLNRVNHKQDASDEAFEGDAEQNHERNHYA